MQFCSRLRNHDELDLGRLPEQQRKRVFAALAPEPEMQLYRRGIRRRLAPMLGGDRRRMELAFSLLCTLPGTPVLWYGDEIGMGDDPALHERNCGRTPMQWSNEPNAGFSNSEHPAMPAAIRDEPFGYKCVSVAQQRRDPNSFLNWSERIIRMRKELLEIGGGNFLCLDCGDEAVLAMRYHWRGPWAPSPARKLMSLSARW
jgi:maltose alpha-D-glucosyltransferase / alpha-amylase